MGLQNDGEVVECITAMVGINKHIVIACIYAFLYSFQYSDLCEMD